MKHLFAIWISFLICMNLAHSQAPPLAPEVWSEPVKLDVIGIGGQPSISPMSDQLFFVGSLDTAGSDILRSRKIGSVWQPPTQINSNINQGLEFAPAISPNGRKLYFRRYGGGYGGWDLWASEWSDSLNDWQIAKNLGPNINSEKDEWFCFTPDDTTLYFGRLFGTLIVNVLVSKWNASLQEWGTPRSFDNERLTQGGFVNGFTMTANKSKVYFGVVLDTGKHYELELLVAYFDSSRNFYGNPLLLNLNSHPPDSIPWYNPGNLGYDAYPSITADGKWLYFESDRGPDWNGNNFHGIYVSRLLIDENGNPVSVKEEPVIFPFGFELHQNFPNPFNPETTITFQITQPGEVIVGIYDVLGRQVRKLLAQRLTSGLHSVPWNGQDDQGQLLPSGIYFCRLRAENHVQWRKMLLVR